MFLKFIGNGSAFNTKRGNNCAYVREGDKLFLFDCGESIFERILRENILDGVGDVFVAITHMHTDHVGSLPSLIFYNYYAKNIKTHLLSGDKNKDNALKMFLNLTGVDKSFYEFCSNNLDYKFEHIESCAFEKVEHTKALDQSYAVKLNLKSGEKIYFSGDTCDVDYAKKVVENLKPKDEFYCDCCLLDYPGNVHFNVDKLASITPIEKRKQVFCMHIDREELLQKIDDYGFNYAKLNCETKEKIK